MTNQLKISTRVEWWRDNVLTLQSPLKQKTIETTSDLAVSSVQVVGTLHEGGAIGDVTDDAILVVENLSTTATVQIGGDAAGSFVEWFFLAPGDPPAILGRVGALASTYLKASASTTSVSVTLVKIVAP